MTDNEIIKALECCREANNCIHCEYEPTEYQKGTIGCANELMENAIDLINRQQKLLTNISDLIVENTYPGFDKNGKPVSIWNADGYKKMELNLQ